MSGQTIISYIVYYNDKTNGVEVVKSLPYAISPPSGYVAPDLTKARSLTKSDGLGRSEGSVTYSDATTIVLSTSLSYAVAQGVTGLSSENNNAYEQTTTLDAYNHQSISYSDALGRTRFDQLFSGTTSPTGATLPTYQQSFSYDNIDRMTSGPSGSMTYDSNHVHAAITANSFPDQYAAYDAMGNMTCRNVDTSSGHTCSGGTPTGASMSYDNEGRLISWTAPQGTTATDAFLYDNEGNRVLQRTNDSTGVTDTITFDGYTETVIHGGTTTTTKYYSATGQRVGMKTGNALYYLVNDSLGGTSLVLKSDASVQAVQLFAPYGGVRYSQGTMPTTYNFTGQRLDSETGLLYCNFRYYDPVSGRFARADTVQSNVDGKDSYAYVSDNPETKDDPTGHKDCAGCYQYWHTSNGPIPPVDYLVLAAPLGLLLLFGLGGVALVGIAAPGAAVVTALAPAGVGAISGVTSTALYSWITGKPQSIGDYVESAVVNAVLGELGLPVGFLLMVKPTSVGGFLVNLLVTEFFGLSLPGLVSGVVERIRNLFNHNKQQNTFTPAQVPVAQRDTWWNDPGRDSNSLSTNYPLLPLMRKEELFLNSRCRSLSRRNLDKQAILKEGSLI